MHESRRDDRERPESGSDCQCQHEQPSPASCVVSGALAFTLLSFGPWPPPPAGTSAMTKPRRVPSSTTVSVAVPVVPTEAVPTNEGFAVPLPDPDAVPVPVLV